MSHTDRDQPGRHRSGKRCPNSASGGCPWCQTGSYKKPLRRKLRHAKRRQIIQELTEESS